MGLGLALLTAAALAQTPAAPPQLAYFYKPPLDGTSAAFLASHFQLIILTHGDERYLAQLRAAGYRGLVLQYIAANETEGPGPYANAQARCDLAYPAFQRTVADRDGVFCRAIHPHEDWFLHNLAGARLLTRLRSADRVWRTTYLMNPASSGWRAFLIARLRQYRRLGFDGFFLDNLDLSRAGLLRQPTTRGGVAEFSTDARYRAAETAYLAALRSAFPGVPIWANLTHDPYQTGGWRAYLPALDGVMVENFGLGWPRRPLTAAALAAQLANVRAVLAQGKGVIAVVQGAQHDSARLQTGLDLYRSLLWRQPGDAPSTSGRPLPGIEARPPSDQRERPRQKVASHPARGPLYFRYADAFDHDYRTVWWFPAYTKVAAGKPNP
ncbi:MAG: putative glycoside hydrolase [Terriglobales bacterium]